jgi:hypothetical protein
MKSTLTRSMIGNKNRKLAVHPIMRGGRMKRGAQAKSCGADFTARAAICRNLDGNSKGKLTF